MVKIIAGKEFIAVADSAVENNSIFLDSADNVIKVKDNSGVIKSFGGILGEIRMFALSMTGAVTKSSLQSQGWAICDGTTPAAQGISSPTIATTPDLQHSFIRMSNDDSSGTTGGSGTHTHELPFGAFAGNNNQTVLAVTNSEVFGTGGSASAEGKAYNLSISAGGIKYLLTSSTSNLPTYYEVAYFIKVK